MRTVSQWRNTLKSIDRLYLWSALFGLAAAMILIEIGLAMQGRGR